MKELVPRLFSVFILLSSFFLVVVVVVVAKQSLRPEQHRLFGGSLSPLLQPV